MDYLHLLKAKPSILVSQEEIGLNYHEFRPCDPQTIIKPILSLN